MNKFLYPCPIMLEFMWADSAALIVISTIKDILEKHYSIK